MLRVDPLDIFSKSFPSKTQTAFTPQEVLAADANKASFNCKVRAINAHGFSGDSGAIEPLLRCLADSDSGIRGWAAFALGELLSEINCTEADVCPLRYALLSEGDKAVRLAIEAALRRIEESRDKAKLSKPHYLISKIKITDPGPLEVAAKKEGLFF